MELKQLQRSWGMVEQWSKHDKVFADHVKCLQGDQCAILGFLDSC